MAMQNYTDYLGKQVEFFSPVPPLLGGKFDIVLYEKIEGIITGVVLLLPIAESEFFLNGNTYQFKNVSFTKCELTS